MILSVVIGCRSLAADPAKRAGSDGGRGTSNFPKYSPLIACFFLCLGAVHLHGWLEIPSFQCRLGHYFLFLQCFNVEIFRAGLKRFRNPPRKLRIPRIFRLQTYRYIVLPWLFRVSLPALNNNLVNLVKPQPRLVIAVPELFADGWHYNDYSTSMNACMLLLFVVYIVLVGILDFGMQRWNAHDFRIRFGRDLRHPIPGLGPGKTNTYFQSFYRSGNASGQTGDLRLSR